MHKINHSNYLILHAYPSDIQKLLLLMYSLYHSLLYIIFENPKIEYIKNNYIYIYTIEDGIKPSIGIC